MRHPNLVIAAVFLLLVGASCSDDDSQVKAGGATDSTTPISEPGAVDPTAPEPGDESVCEAWELEGSKVKADGGYTVQDEAPQRDPNQTRPYDAGISGSQADPAKYLSTSNRDRLKGRNGLLMPTWLPQEVLDEVPELFLQGDSTTGHTVRWNRAADGSSPMVYVQVNSLPPANAAQLRDTPRASNVTIQGKPGWIAHAIDGEFVHWLWAPDIDVSIAVDALDYRLNCQELLAVARSVEPFDPNQ